MNIERCDLCPRKCGVDRGKKAGFCQAGDKIEISWSGLHFGEEPVISGRMNVGSGTIFFCRCNLKCVFCQNWQISQNNEGGKKYENAGVVKIILNLQEKGASNINLVSPTVWSYWLKEIILKAKKEGLKIPVVWNSNGYEEVRVLKEMEGLVDIYLPDYKYASEKLAVKYSAAPSYSSIAQKAILEMQRQVGNLQINENGLAKRGLIVRHLILPDAMENTKGALRFISTISPKAHLSLMSQYNPTYKACEFGEINRPIFEEEFTTAKKLMDGFGIKYGWVQEFGGSVKCLNPDFSKKNPFG